MLEYQQVAYYRIICHSADNSYYLLLVVYFRLCFPSPAMEITALEAEAKEKAAKHVANMLHAPDKLEKVIDNCGIYSIFILYTVDCTVYL